MRWILRVRRRKGNPEAPDFTSGFTGFTPKHLPRRRLQGAFFVCAGLVLAMALSGSGCGLPTVSFLAPPVIPGTRFEGPPTQRRLFFAHNTDNDFDDFEGYDIWYKLYANTSAGEDLRDSDELFIEDSPRQAGSGRLQNRRFRRAIALRRDGSNEFESFSDGMPVVPFEPRSNRTVFELDLRPPFARESPQPSSTTAEITVTSRDDDQTRAWLRRRNRSADDVTNPVGQSGFFSFWDSDSYFSGQTDVYSGLLSADDGARDFIIVIYALSVGLDRSQARFQRFYSEPRRLEEAIITFSDGGN